MKMENICCVVAAEEEEVELPAGFRFHPTDEELISHYLHPKVVDPNFSARAIGEVDLNKCEPWDLPKRAKMGETEWYFFWLKDRKYPTGLRTNRATEAGYWKATGKDKQIYKGNSLVGMKKTLVFYKGRAPKGHKSNWVMHEYRLDGILSPLNLPTSTSSKNEWVISRTFQKSSSGKKIPFPGLARTASLEFPSLVLPPLMDSSPYTDPRHVSCFSSPIAPQGYQYPRSEGPIPFYSHQVNLFSGESQYPTGVWHESEILRSILEGNGVSVSHDTCLSIEMNPEISSVVSNYEMGRGPFDEGPSTFGGPVDTESIWDIY